MPLKDEIQDAKQNIRTETVQITIGEIATMYENHELNIHPVFQRLFRWSNQKKSDFIESLFINIPIPPAFAYETETGVWELVDGLQRISTILEFMGVLRNPDDNSKMRSTLTSTKYLNDLNGVVWEKTEGDADELAPLDKALQLFFRRTRIDFQVLKSPSDEKSKFDLFQRLNRGGVYATEQEVRSCAMYMIEPEKMDSLKSISEREDFKRVFRITDEQTKKQVDLEYMTRILVHSNSEYDNKSEVQDFLDSKIVEVLPDLDINKAISEINWTIEKLDSAYGGEALLPKEGAPQGLANRFSLRALEAIFVGIMKNIEAIQAMEKPDVFLKTQITDFWKQDAVKDMSSPGLTGTLRLRRTLPFGAEWFCPNANA